LEDNAVKKNRSITLRINPFKLFYYRKTAGVTIEGLSKTTAIPVRRLKRYERGTFRSEGRPQHVTEFAEIDEVSLRRIEDALKCKGGLRAGRDDDFGTLFLQYYETKRHQSGPLEPSSEGATGEEAFHPKAIVFDFDGTLTRPDLNRTTWERLWTQLGYTDNECGKLAYRFFTGEIDHDKWCQLTLEKFKARGLREDAVVALGESLELIEGFGTTIERLKQAGIHLYIVSGSIRDVVTAALGEYNKFFDRVEANIFSYTHDADRVITHIAGTKYDFAEKANFIKLVAEDLHIPASQILFIGNSINDEDVKRLSGAKTLLVNPHFTTPSSKKWDAYIPHMKSLEEILPYVGLDESPSERQRVTATEAEQAEQIISLLRNKDIIDLDRYTVVGGYRRFNPDVRADLISLCQRIRASLTSQSSGRQNYLICAAPGSGKTYFIQEVANSLGDKIKFVEIDLSKDEEDVVKHRLDEVNGDTSCLCMIDEIDGRAGEQWPYEVIYKKLDVNELSNRRATTVFALIGSSGGDPNGLKDAIRSRHKAGDLINRIPDNPQYCVTIPPLEVGDGICVYVSKVLEASAKKNAGITHVEKMAVFHAAMTVIDSPRQITTLAEHAVDRVRGGDNVLRYNHHFDDTDNSDKSFWEKHKNAVSLLGSRQIKIS
jgi:phosphoserine phosphatase